MIDIIIIADDFTGALDTGVQFASKGIKTLVKTGTDCDFDKLSAKEIQILVLDTETRHLSADEAYQIVYKITKKALEKGVHHVYKKTDSALRGNIGSELTAVLDASGNGTLPFIPALPCMNRITRRGVHYIDDRPVSDSVFGNDPFEPVTCSYIPDIIALQSKVKTRVIEENVGEGTTGEIDIYDASSDSRLTEIAEELFQKNGLPIMAGCSGFASVLPTLLKMKSKKKAVTFSKEGLLVVNGSLNPITAGQLEYAEKGLNFYRMFLSPEQKLELDYWKTPKGLQDLHIILEESKKQKYMIIDVRDKDENGLTNHYAESKQMDLEQARKQITHSVGKLVRYLVENHLQQVLMVIGGDTLQSILQELDVNEMYPVCELLPGTVVSEFVFDDQSYQLISKSGGFGEKILLMDIVKKILGDNGKEKENG